MNSGIKKRIEKIEDKLNMGKEPPVIFEYTAENGIEQKIEMPSDDFDKLLKEIQSESKGLPIKE